MNKWLELAHEKHGHIYPVLLYWLSAPYASEYIGVKNKTIGVWFRNNGFSYLVTENAFLEIAIKIKEKLVNEKKFLDDIIESNKIKIPIMLKAAEKLSGDDLKNMSGKELCKEWDDWHQKFIDMMILSVMATVMEMEKPIYTNMLEEVVKKKVGENDSRQGEYFQTLTTPIGHTVADKEELDLIKLGIKDTKGILKNQDIAEHTKKYSWIAFGYDGPGWSMEDIKERVKELPNNKRELEIILKNKEGKKNNLEKKIKIIENDLGLSEDKKYLFYVARILGFWKFERKSLNQKAHELMEEFFKEIARRNNLSVAQAKMIAPNEMKKVLIQEQVDENILNERLKECVILYKGKDYQVLSGKNAKDILQEIHKSFEIDKNISKLEGTTAYPGKVTGIVRRVDEAGEMCKMKDGDILVSESTSPHILPAMKQAGAIVADTGGITCHAAIIAREIKIPTVIGAKLASKVLKDGDEVEVDAEKGIVRKLS